MAERGCDTRVEPVKGRGSVRPQFRPPLAMPFISSKPTFQPFMMNASQDAALSNANKPQRTMKEYHQELDSAKKENFALKLQIYHLEHRIANIFKGKMKAEDLIANSKLEAQVKQLLEDLKTKEEILRRVVLNNVEKDEQIAHLMRKIGELESLDKLELSDEKFATPLQSDAECDSFNLPESSLLTAHEDDQKLLNEKLEQTVESLNDKLLKLILDIELKDKHITSLQHQMEQLVDAKQETDNQNALVLSQYNKIFRHLENLTEFMEKLMQDSDFQAKASREMVELATLHYNESVHLSQNVLNRDSSKKSHSDAPSAVLSSQSLINSHPTTSSSMELTDYANDFSSEQEDTTQVNSTPRLRNAPSSVTPQTSNFVGYKDFEGCQRNQPSSDNKQCILNTELSKLLELSSDSDVWSEPDKGVSFERVGIELRDSVFIPNRKRQKRNVCSQAAKCYEDHTEHKNLCDETQQLAVVKDKLDKISSQLEELCIIRDASPEMSRQLEDISSNVAGVKSDLSAVVLKISTNDQPSISNEKGTQEIDVLKNENNKLSELIQDLEREKKVLSVKHDHEKLEIKKAATKQYEEMTQFLKTCKDELQKRQAFCTELEKELSGAKSQIATLQKEIDSYQIESAKSSELIEDYQQDKTDRSQKQLEFVSDENLVVKLDQYKAILEKSEKKLAKVERQLEDANRNNMLLRKEIEELQSSNLENKKLKTIIAELQLQLDEGEISILKENEKLFQSRILELENQEKSQRKLIEAAKAEFTDCLKKRLEEKEQYDKKLETDNLNNMRKIAELTHELERTKSERRELELKCLDEKGSGKHIECSINLKESLKKVDNLEEKLKNTNDEIMSLRDEIKECKCENGNLTMKIQNLHSDTSCKEQTITQLKDNLDQTTAKLKDFQIKCSEYEKDVVKYGLCSTMLEKSQIHHSEVTKELENLNRQLRNEIGDYKAENKDFKEQIRKLQSNNLSNERTISGLTRDLEDTKAKLKTLEHKCSGYEIKMAEHNNRSLILEDSQMKCSKVIKELEKTNGQLTKEVESYKSGNEILKLQVDKLQDELSSNKSETSKFTQDLEHTSDKLKEYQLKCLDYEKDIEEHIQCNIALEESQNMVLKFEKQLENANSNNISLKQELNNLKSEMERCKKISMSNEGRVYELSQYLKQTKAKLKETELQCVHHEEEIDTLKGERKTDLENSEREKGHCQRLISDLQLELKSTKHECEQQKMQNKKLEETLAQQRIAALHDKRKSEGTLLNEEQDGSMQEISQLDFLRASNAELRNKTAALKSMMFNRQQQLNVEATSSLENAEDEHSRKISEIENLVQKQKVHINALAKNLEITQNIMNSLDIELVRKTTEANKNKQQLEIFSKSEHDDYIKTIFELESENSRQRAKISEVTKKLRNRQGRDKETRNQMAVLESRNIALLNQVAGLQEQVSGLQNEVQQQHENAVEKNVDNNISQMQLELERRISLHQAQMERHKSEHKSTLNQLQSEILQLTKTLTEKSIAMSSLQTKISNYEEDICSLNLDLNKKQTDLTSKNDEISIMEKKIASLDKIINILRDERTKNKETYKIQLERRDSFDEEVRFRERQLGEQLSKKTIEISKLEMKLEEAIDKVQEMEVTLELKNGLLTEKDIVLNALQDSIKTLQNTISEQVATAHTKDQIFFSMKDQSSILTNRLAELEGQVMMLKLDVQLKAKQLEDKKIQATSLEGKVSALQEKLETYDGLEMQVLGLKKSEEEMCQEVKNLKSEMLKSELERKSFSAENKKYADAKWKLVQSVLDAQSEFFEDHPGSGQKKHAEFVRQLNILRSKLTSENRGSGFPLFPSTLHLSQPVDTDLVGFHTELQFILYVRQFIKNYAVKSVKLLEKANEEIHRLKNYHSSRLLHTSLSQPSIMQEVYQRKRQFSRPLHETKVEIYRHKREDETKPTAFDVTDVSTTPGHPSYVTELSMKVEFLQNEIESLRMENQSLRLSRTADRFMTGNISDSHSSLTNNQDRDRARRDSLKNQCLSKDQSSVVNYRPDNHVDSVFDRSHYSSPDLGIESDPNQETALPDLQLAVHNSLAHAIGKLPDFELLKKEIEECLVGIKNISSRANDCLDQLGRSSSVPKKNIVPATLCAILDNCDHLQVCLIRSQELIAQFWISSEQGLVQTSSDWNNVLHENDNLKKQLIQLLTDNEKEKAEFYEAMQRLKNAEVHKQRYEKKLSKQLIITKKILRRTKTKMIESMPVKS